jgi:hypothetical protein
MRLNLLGFIFFILGGGATSLVHNDTPYCYNVIRAEISSGKPQVYRKCVRGDSINYQRTVGSGQHNSERTCYDIYKTNHRDVYSKCVMGDKITYSKNTKTR